MDRPAWQASRVDLNETLKQSGRTLAGGGGRRLRQGLVVVGLALAVTSLADAGLAIHSFWQRTHVDLGVRTEHILTFSPPVTREQLNERERIEAFYRQLLERLRTVPGVTHASASTSLPLQGVAGMPFPSERTGPDRAELPQLNVQDACGDLRPAVTPP